MTLPVVLEQNHIANRQFFVIFLRETENVLLNYG